LGYGGAISNTPIQNISNEIGTSDSQVNHLHQLKIKEHTFVVIEYTDIELEEEYHNDDTNVNYRNSVVSISNSYYNWHPNFSAIFASDWYHSSNPANVSLGQLSSPIYLKNNVFRI
ncbi:MAG: hypothetical protein RLZZ196_3462, partial [Bacteroidota bacterium]